MQFPYLGLTILISHVIAIHGLVTMQTIRDITNTTNECRGRITRKEIDVQDGTTVVGLMGGGLGQNVLMTGSRGDEDGEELEDTVAAALKILCQDLLVELEKPLDDQIPPEPSVEDLRCRVIIREYHAFLGATVKFLHEIQERQMLWSWSHESPVFDGVSWLQGLWASRSTNNQDRSFIEQQMIFYGGTGCFGKSQEVLRRDVEIVEYMNDLIDLFD